MILSLADARPPLYVLQTTSPPDAPSETQRVAVYRALALSTPPPTNTTDSPAYVFVIPTQTPTDPNSSGLVTGGFWTPLGTHSETFPIPAHTRTTTTTTYLMPRDTLELDQNLPQAFRDAADYSAYQRNPPADADAD